MHGVLAVLLAIPWQSTKAIRMLDRAVLHDRSVRSSFYHSAIASQWVLAVITFGVLWSADPAFASGMLTNVPTPDSMLIVALAALLLMSQSPLVPFVRRRMAKSGATGRMLYPMRNVLPRTARERRLWLGVCATAGVCEELLYRGFLFYYAATILGFGTAGAIALSSLIFAVGHVYQGAINVLRVGVVGALLGIVYAATDNLAACVALHAFLDLGALRLGDYVPADDLA